MKFVVTIDKKHKYIAEADSSMDAIMDAMHKNPEARGIQVERADKSYALAHYVAQAEAATCGS